MPPSERHRATPSSRIPWMTYLLLVLVVVCFEVAAGSTRDVEGARDASLDEAADYLDAHPYLEPSPALARRMDGVLQKQRRRFEADLDRRGAPPIPDGVKRRQQETLDGLLATSVAARHERPAWRFGLIPAAPRPASFLSYALLHAGWAHLLANLLPLLVLGVFLESAWGGFGVAGFVAFGAAVAGAAGAIASPDLDVPLIGASGVVATLLGAFAIRFARRGNPAYPLVLLSGLVWLGLTAWLGARWTLAEGPGAYEPALAARACLAMLAGGAAAGALASAALSFSRVESASLHPRREAARTHRGNPRLEKALEAQSRGRDQEAFEMLSRAFEQDVASPDVALALWDVALSLGRPADAAPAMLRVLRDDVRRNDHQAVVDHWLELDERGLSVDADPTLLMRVAAILRQEDHPSAALNALQLALAETDSSKSPIVASRVARAAVDLDPEIAEQAAWRALGSVDLGLEERQALEEMLGELYRGRDIDPRRRGRAHRYGKPDSSLRAAPPDAAGVPDAATPPVRGPGERSDRPAAIELDLGERALELSVVTPLALEDEGVRVELTNGKKRLLHFRAIDAVAVAAVHGLGAKPVILIDLVLNWMSLRHEPLKVVRLRGDRFDPHRLSAGHPSALAALRAFLEVLIERTGATPLPDPDAAVGRPFAVLADLATYQRDVLMADGAPLV